MPTLGRLRGAARGERLQGGFGGGAESAAAASWPLRARARADEGGGLSARRLGERGGDRGRGGDGGRGGGDDDDVRRLDRSSGGCSNGP